MNYLEKISSLFAEVDYLLGKSGQRQLLATDPEDENGYYFKLFSHDLVVHLKAYPGLSSANRTFILGRLLNENNNADGPDCRSLTEIEEQPSRFSAEIPNYDPRFLVNLITTNLAKERRIPQKD